MEIFLTSLLNSADQPCKTYPFAVLKSRLNTAEFISVGFSESTKPDQEHRNSFQYVIFYED